MSKKLFPFFRIHYCIILILVIICIGATSKIIRLKRDTKDLTIKLKEEIKSKSVIEENFSFFNYFENRIIDINNIKQDNFEFKKQFKIPKLILYLREGDCFSCMKYQLNLLNKVADSIGIENILIFLQHKSQLERLIKLVFTDDSINLKYLKVENDLFESYNNTPLVFTLDSNMVINHIHQSNEFDSVTNQYYKNVLAYFSLYKPNL